MEVKAYSAFGQSMLLMLVLPIYARLATKWTRRQLITRIGLGFGAMMVVFWGAQPGLLFEHVAYAGLLFYLYVGIFSVTLVAQFWSFASDLYGPERGKRLFPLVALGASSGAVAGSWIGESVLATGVDAYDLLLIALAPTHRRAGPGRMDRQARRRGRPVGGHPDTLGGARCTGRRRTLQSDHQTPLSRGNRGADPAVQLGGRER